MTIYVGIDITMLTLFACVVDQHGKEVVQPFSFKNNIKGFKLLLSHLSNLEHDGVFIGFESIAHYHENLGHFLTNRGYSYELINPLLSKRFSGLNIRDVKNDKVDARTIASFLSVNRNNPVLEQFRINNLKFLSLERDNLIKQRSREYIRLTAYLDRVFPELKPKIKSSLKSRGYTNLLKTACTAQEIAKTRVDTIYKLLNYKRKSYSMTYVKEIKNLAKESVGYHSNEISDIIKRILVQIEFLNAQIDNVESNILSHPLVANSRLNQIPGMGPVQIVYIISVIENISRFDHPSKIIAFAGLDPKIRQSGQFKAHKTRMSKRGSILLRHGIIWSANNVRNNSKTMNDYYLKKRSEGKNHYSAHGHCAKKVVSYIFFILTNPEKDFVLEYFHFKQIKHSYLRSCF